MLKIDRDAIARIKALAESHPPLDPVETMRKAIAAGGENFDDYTLVIEPGYTCVFTIETVPPLVYNHMSIRAQFPVTQAVIEEIAKAFGFGERRTWTIQPFVAAGAWNIAKIKTH